MDKLTLCGILLGFSLAGLCGFIGVVVYLMRREDRFYDDRWNGRLG